VTRSSNLFVRAAATGLAAVVATALAACSSSGGGTKTTSGGASPTGGASSAPAGGGGGGGQPGKGKPAITMGDKNFSEEYLLGELYSQALRAKGYTVKLKGNIGSSEITDKALTSGQIDIYPEYTGVIYTELAKHNDRPGSAAQTYAGAKKWEEARGYTILNPTPFQDADGIATLKPYAESKGLKTIADMKKLGSFTYGGPPENATRYQGVVGMKQAYGLNPSFKPLAIGSQYQALNQKKVDSIAIFTTDGQLASGKYAVLTDTKGIFGYQQVVPVIKKTTLAKMGPEFAATLNAVSAALTTDAIVAMNKAVQIDQKDPGVVAKAFLQANKLS
jgi:osmoprotectant transport system substrate-binding protein